MLTRIKVSGFKNLVDTEIRFGPFTCIVGCNGVGKSNVFDAIEFLSDLSHSRLEEAAARVRGGREIGDFFTSRGDGRLRIECDVLIHRCGVDDFGQEVETDHTYLAYSVELALVDGDLGGRRIELIREDLRGISRNRARARLGFECSDEWFDSAVLASDRRVPYIGTIEHDEGARVRVYSDGARADQEGSATCETAHDFLASRLPRTALSGATSANDTRTAALVRVEMMSWKTYHLEPSSLREPDTIGVPPVINRRGGGLPANLYRLKLGPNGDNALVDISNRLAEIVDGVKQVRVERDIMRRTLQVVLMDKQGVEFPAASLSVGTLRFMAFCAIERSPWRNRLFCIEEPETGIHPERMGAMMNLLRAIATDVDFPIDADNPLQQVIINTHSPGIVAHANPNDVLFADLRDPPSCPGKGPRAIVVKHYPETWRGSFNDSVEIDPGRIVSYLVAAAPSDDDSRGPTVFKRAGARFSLRFEDDK